MADWSKIKTEYITTSTSYRKLAAKYGIDQATVARRAKKEGWCEARKRHADKTQAKILNADTTNKANRAEKLQTAADKLMEKVVAIIEASDPQTMDTQSLRHLSSTLKDIKDIQMIKSDADVREQEARINKLQKETEENKDDSVKITLSIPEEYIG